MSNNTFGKSNLNQALLGFIFFGVMFAIIKLVVLQGAYFDNFLFLDDSIFVGKMYILDVVPTASNRVMYYFYFALVQLFDSVAAVKISLPIISSFIFLTIARLLYKNNSNFIVAILAAALISQYPIDVQQNIFAAGAHPTLAVLTALIDLSIFYAWLTTPTLSRRKVSFLAIAHIILTYITINISPTFVLYPIGGLFFAIPLLRNTSKNLSRKKQFQAIVLVGVIFPILFIYPAIANHHYTGIVGWTNVSISQILINTFALIREIFKFTVFSNFQMVCFIIFGALMLFAVALRILKEGVKKITQASPSSLWCATYCFLVAGLVFGPGSIVTVFASRYAVAPFMFLSLGCAFLLSGVFTKSPLQAPKRTDKLAQKFNFAAVGVGIMCAAMSFKGNVTETKKMLSPYHDHFSELEIAVKDIDVKKFRQILVFVGPKNKSATNGQNHWSTWQLRVLTKDPEIIGLIGSKRRVNLERGLFKSNTSMPIRDEFWEVSDGRSRRISMFGLEQGLPLAVLEHTKTGNYVELDAMNWVGSNIGFSGQSETWDLSSMEDAKNYCGMRSEKKNDFQPYFINLNPSMLEQNFISMPEFNRIFDGGNSVRLNVNIENDEMFAMKFSIKSKSAGVDNNSETTPPMPILGPAFGIYQKEHGLVLSGRGSGLVELSSSIDKKVEVMIYGCNSGEKAVFVNDVFSGIFSSETITGNWTIGKGFKERYWEGEISNVEFRRNTTLK